MGDDHREQLAERLKTLEARIKAHKNGETRQEVDESKKSGLGAAMKLSSEFIVSIAVGAALGYTIDWFLGTLPWAMVFFLLLGFGAGVLNLMRAVGLANEPDIALSRVERKRRHDANADDDG